MQWSLLFSAVLLVFFIVICLSSFGYPFEAGLFPWVIGIPTTVLMLIQFVKEIAKMRHATEQKALSQKRPGDPRAYALTILSMACFLGMIYVLGFIISIPLYLFLYLKLNGFGWFRSAGLAAGTIILIYVIFSLAMRMPLYNGLLLS